MRSILNQSNSNGESIRGRLVRRYGGDGKWQIEFFYNFVYTSSDHYPLRLAIQAIGRLLSECDLPGHCLTSSLQLFRS